MDIGTLVTRAAQRFGDRVAVEGPDADRTFAQLGDRVARIANGLLAQGLRPGDRVLDLQRNSTTYLETDLAIRAAGLVRAALNYRLHPSDWERIAADSGARALVYDPAFEEQTEALRSGIERRRLHRRRPRALAREAHRRRPGRADPGARAGRAVRAALLVGHDRPSQGRAAHPPQLDGLRRQHDPRRARRPTRPARLLRARRADHPHLRPVRAAVPRRRRPAGRPAGLGPRGFRRRRPRARGHPHRDRADHGGEAARLRRRPRRPAGAEDARVRRRPDAAGADAPGPRPPHPQPRAVLRARRGHPAGDRPRRG